MAQRKTYRWEIAAFGRTQDERIRRKPTKQEIETAVVLIVRFTNVDNPDDQRWVTIRHPTGFGVGALVSATEDIAVALETAADRYECDLVFPGDIEANLYGEGE